MRKAFDLRPLEFNDVLGRSFSLFMANFVGYLRWVIIAWLLPMLAMAVLLYFTLDPYDWVARGGESPGVVEPNHYAAFYWLLKAAALVLAFTSGAAGIYYMTARIYVGGNPTLNETMRAVFERMTHVAGVGLVHALVAGGFTLFCWLTPFVLWDTDRSMSVLAGLVLWTAWLPLFLWYMGVYGLNCSTVMLDDAQVTEAFQRSAFLTKSSRMRLIGVLCATVLLVGAPGFPGILSIPSMLAANLLVEKDLPWAAVLLDVAWDAIVLPLFFIPLVVYYFDQRCRRESYDLAVMARNFGIEEGEMQRYRFNPGLGYMPKGYKAEAGRRRKPTRMPAQRTPAQRQASAGMPTQGSPPGPWGPQPGMTGGFHGQAQYPQQAPPQWPQQGQPQWPQQAPQQWPPFDPAQGRQPNPNPPPLPGVRPPGNFPNRGPGR
ncbi:MAG: hypothetical protein H6839_17650 [Planctomycetes bacterium]|nr:hypothetical protein [Planctomycetota bacterium]